VRFRFSRSSNFLVSFGWNLYLCRNSERSPPDSVALIGGRILKFRSLSFASILALLEAGTQGPASADIVSGKAATCTETLSAFATPPDGPTASPATGDVSDLESLRFALEIRPSPTLVIFPIKRLAPCTKVRTYTRNMEGLTTAQLASEGGVNVETIRYYERHGLLPKPPRTPSGYRVFSEEAVTCLRFIKRSQELGFSLNEIKELLSLRVKPGSSCVDVRRKAEAKVVDVDEKIRRLQKIRKALVELTNICSGRGPVSTCSILRILNAGETS